MQAFFDNIPFGVTGLVDVFHCSEIVLLAERAWMCVSLHQAKWCLE